MVVIQQIKYFILCSHVLLRRFNVLTILENFLHRYRNFWNDEFLLMWTDLLLPSFVSMGLNQPTSLLSHKKQTTLDKHLRDSEGTWQKTNELKISVFRTKFASGPSSSNSVFPLACSIHITMSWYRAWPKIFLHITLLMIFAPLPTWFLFINSSCGGSLANAKAPRVSMITFTHNSCTAVRGVLPEG